jgi:hypothetical protein
MRKTIVATQLKKLDDKSFEEKVSWRKKVGIKIAGNEVKWASIKGIPEMQM